MNELLLQLENLNDRDLAYLFEYLIELMNERKLQEQRKANKNERRNL